MCTRCWSRAKNLSVLLSSCFEVIALFFLAVDFFLRFLAILSNFRDSAIAASTCASSRFENVKSAKELRNLERIRFIEYCESSQRAMTFSLDLYSSPVGKLISAQAWWEFRTLSRWLVPCPRQLVHVLRADHRSPKFEELAIVEAEEDLPDRVRLA
jgi:hypothetical protein